MASKNKGSKMSVKLVAPTEKNVKPIKKAEEITNIEESESQYSEWIPQPAPLIGFKNVVFNSSILPQCIDAYKKNIAGFGIEVRYKDDCTDSKELEKEFKDLSDIVETLTLDCDTKEIFEHVVESREIYGIAYIEVIRSNSGSVEEIAYINNTYTIEKSRLQDDPILTDYYYEGRKIVRNKRFRKYRQQINGKTVYFKEFGDKRLMNKDTGVYSENLESSMQANEILEFKIGTEPYGTIRWYGNILNVDGSRKAENLNNNYFENGRHTPLMIMIKGGTLTDESFEKLQKYMDGIKGEAGQHGFMILEAEENANSTDLGETKQPEIEIKDLAGILQHDELFQDYLDNNRKKVQSAFRLPDLYVGYTTDFNRATAQVAMEVTEEQVFQVERQSLAWIINNKLLNEYQFKNVEVYFKEPDITNPDDLFKIMSATNNAGGLTPNKAKEILYNALGEVSEDYDGDWGEIPLAYQKTVSGLNKQIEKAAENHDDEIVAVMKSVKSAMAKFMDKGGS